MDIKVYIQKNESLRLEPYKCSAGKLTIGWGHNLDDRGIPLKIAQDLFEYDYSIAQEELISVFESKIVKMSENRYCALVDMMFQLGLTRFRKFKKMIQAIKNGDWVMAYNECLDSKYAKRDTPGRAKRNALLLLDDLCEDEMMNDPTDR